MQQFKQKLKNFQKSILMGMLVCMSFSFASPDAITATNLKTNIVAAATTTVATTKSVIEEKMGLYETLGLEAKGLSRQAFEYALEGYNKLLSSGKLEKENLLSILDFSLPSSKKRLFIVDLTSGELVFNTYAAHGSGSGMTMATKFSNQPNSYQSSLGFYVTGETYNGKHGQSLRLNGEEEGFNDNALERGVVMHSAAYVDESVVAAQGRIGRSQGCPALPESIAQEIINKVKNGSCLFLYSPDKDYTSHSKFLNENS
jgi:hypothetical protein